MAGNTKIQWAGSTWNPIRAVTLGAAADNQRWGYHCEHVSEGCRNCYAERMNGRMCTGLPYTRQSREKVEIFLDPGELLKPVGWKKPRRIFPCSMTDMFADFVSDDLIHQMFSVMAMTPRHTYQVLTKRAARMAEYPCPRLPNVWMGVSVEDQRTADERIPLLLRTPAAVRWVSYEPALESVDWHPYLVPKEERDGYAEVLTHFPAEWTVPKRMRLRTSLDWIVIGGESGPGARPFDLHWAWKTIDQFRNAGVPCFVKQFGAFPKREDKRLKLRDRKGGDMSEWPEWARVREFPSEERHGTRAR